MVFTSNYPTFRIISDTFCKFSREVFPDVVACTLIKLTEGTSEKNRKSVEKEMQIRATLKHTKVLQFLNAVVELKHQATYVPGIYMLLESEEGLV